VSRQAERSKKALGLGICVTDGPHRLLPEFQDKNDRVL
jgi:hypothetical protein